MIPSQPRCRTRHSRHSSVRQSDFTAQSPVSKVPLVANYCQFARYPSRTLHTVLLNTTASPLFLHLENDHTLNADPGIDRRFASACIASTASCLNPPLPRTPALPQGSRQQPFAAQSALNPKPFSDRSEAMLVYPVCAHTTSLPI